MRRTVWSAGVTCFALAAATMYSRDAQADGPNVQFTACPTLYEVYNTPQIGDSIRAVFEAQVSNYQLTIQMNEKVSTALTVDVKGATTFVFWQWFQPSSYAVTTLTALAVAKHRVTFAIYYHPIPNAPQADQMAFDSYGFIDGGPGCP